jgi:hypothetical protein
MATGGQSSSRPASRRWIWSLALLGILAVLTVLTIAVSGDDETAEGEAPTSTTATTRPDGPVSDEELTPFLLPPVGALGPEWIETQREDEATEAEALPEEGCANFPIPEGYVIRGEHQRTQGAEIVEGLSVTAGIVAEGVEAPSLDDELVVGCLVDTLRASLAEGATADVSEGVTVGAPPPGAIVSHLRIEITGEPPVGGTLDFVLVQRDRLVSLGLLQGVDPEIATPLGDVVEALDAPLQAALPYLQ